MKHDILKIINILSVRERVKPIGSHLVKELIMSNSSPITFNERVSLMSLFSLVEKAMREARLDNVNYSGFYFDEIDKRSNFNHGFASYIECALVCPAKAFYLYKFTDKYEEAISLLKESITGINKITEAGISAAIDGAIDQYLNICRLLCKQKGIHEAMKECGSLLYFLLTNKSLLQYASIVIPAMRSEDDKILMVEYVTNSFVGKCIREIVEGEQYDCLMSLFSLFRNPISDYESFYFHNYGEAARHILRSFESDSIDILQDMTSHLERVFNLPSLLQYYYFARLEKKYLKIYGNDVELEMSIRRYCIERLSLGYLYEDVDALYVPVPSPVRVAP